MLVLILHAPVEEGTELRLLSEAPASWRDDSGTVVVTGPGSPAAITFRGGPLWVETTGGAWARPMKAGGGIDFVPAWRATPADALALQEDRQGMPGWLTGCLAAAASIAAARRG